jgi:hypothetical protein
MTAAITDEHLAQRRTALRALYSEQGRLLV